MKMVKIDPPGTWCQNQAIRELIQLTKVNNFIEFGCGNGELSYFLCSLGFKGVGVDFSDQALEIARNRMERYISDGSFRLVKSNIEEKLELGEKFDLGISMMVIEHIENDCKVINNIRESLTFNGSIILGVPGRMECWGIEDETVGHFRRYDKVGLERLLKSEGFEIVRNWSVTVPVSNFLLFVSNFLISRFENRKKEFSKIDQTKHSGIRGIPFKTVFPSFFKLILNKYTLWPIFWLQRRFYDTNYGLTLICLAKKETTFENSI
jgi:SAM-dependent methyltransferase